MSRSRSPLAWLTGTVLLAASALSVPAPASATLGSGEPAQVVVKVAPSCTLAQLTQSAGLVVVGAIVPSRGIYQVRSTDPRYVGDVMASLLVLRLKLNGCVTWAEADQAVSVGDTRFHSWPDGDPRGIDVTDWRQQPATDTLRLAQAQASSTGRGAVVAVLDTGVDPTHPLLAGRVTGGWDYVDDDADPTDREMGVDSDGDGRRDAAYGHGTFVAGLALLVAPQASILPLRVLDSDGVGNVFTVAQAISDAVDAGATVVNLSFGSGVSLRSQVLREAIWDAYLKGVAVVAAAGNDGGSQTHYPAGESGVVSVAAADPTDTTLAPFSARGSWVDVAAPGQDLVGPLPGNRYAVWSGTSMAAPLVSGQLALLDAVSSSTVSRLLSDVVLSTAVRRSDMAVRYGAVDPVGSLSRTLRLSGR